MKNVPQKMYRFKKWTSDEERAEVMKIIKYTKDGLIYQDSYDAHPELQTYFESVEPDSQKTYPTGEPQLTCSCSEFKKSSWCKHMPSGAVKTGWNEPQLSADILDCFVVVNTDQMGNARYDIDFNKLSKEFATARAEGAQEERERIKQVITPKLAALESTAYEYPNSDYIKGQEDLADEIMQALTTKEHHAS